MGRVAAVAGPVLSLLVPATMPLIGYSSTEVRAWAVLTVLTAAVTGALAWLAPWHRWPDQALLVVPLTSFGCLALLGHASDGRASAYGGFATLLFLFVGLTQRRWTSLALLPVAVVTLVQLNGGLTAPLVVRIPISLMVWVATAEIVCAYRMRIRGTLDDLTNRADIDALTRLHNRHGLPGLLRRLVGDDAVLLVDLDRFKALNDSAGHAAGDDVLSDFGAVLRGVVRVSDRAVRYGGEEFLILLPGAGLAGAQALDARLRAAWHAVRPDVTFSGGIALAGEDARPALERADEALYAAKAAGRACTLVHDRQMAARPMSS